MTIICTHRSKVIWFQGFNTCTPLPLQYNCVVQSCSAFFLIVWFGFACTELYPWGLSMQFFLNSSPSFYVFPIYISLFKMKKCTISILNPYWIILLINIYSCTYKYMNRLSRTCHIFIIFFLSTTSCHWPPALGAWVMSTVIILWRNS